MSANAINVTGELKSDLSWSVTLCPGEARARPKARVKTRIRFTAMVNARVKVRVRVRGSLRPHHPKPNPTTPS